MTTLAPSQPLDALKEANKIRLDRAALKQRLKRSDVGFIVSTILDVPECLETARVADVVRVLPRFGPDKTRRLVAACSFSSDRRLGELTERQRRELVAHLRRSPAWRDHQ